MPNFAGIASPWNLRFASTVPQAIARCATREDVRSCLLWAQANSMPLVARSGGHSYAGYSTTTGLMIDLSLMNQVAYDAGSGLARVGGGRATPMSTPRCAPSAARLHMVGANASVWPA